MNIVSSRSDAEKIPHTGVTRILYGEKPRFAEIIPSTLPFVIVRPAVAKGYPNIFIIEVGTIELEKFHNEDA